MVLLRSDVAAAVPSTGEHDALVDFARAMLARQPTEDTETAQFDLPFLRLTVSASDGAWLAACRRALAQGYGQEPRAPLYAHSFTLPDGADGHLGDTASGAFGLERRLSAGGLSGALAAPSGMWSFLDPGRGRAVQVLRRPCGWPAWETAAPWRQVLAWAHLAAGRLMVHGATLGHAGHGVLIAGKGGSGKSGTTLAGLMAGLDTAGDDYVLLEPGQELARAWPLYRLAKQDRAGLARLGLQDRADGVENWQGKFEFDIEALGSGRLAPLSLRAVVLPRITHGARCRFSRVSAREALLALAPSGIFQLVGDAARSLALHAAVLRKLPAYQLELGSDPREIGDAIATFLEQQA